MALEKAPPTLQSKSTVAYVYLPQSLRPDDAIVLAQHREDESSDRWIGLKEDDQGLEIVINKEFRQIVYDKLLSRT